MNNPVTARFQLARAWHGKGSAAPAIAGYREVLALEPGHLDAALLLGGLLQEHQRLDEAVEAYRRAIEYHPIEAQLHKQFVNVMLLQEGPGAVFRYYRLDRQDPKVSLPRPADVLCCIALKNEILRLPYFLDFYRRKGIGAFLAVDNGSTDGSLEYMLDQPDVYLWRSELEFLQRANSGASWFEPILRQFGQDHWCVMVDADELFYYPDCEHRSIVHLCRDLDRKKKRAMNRDAVG